MRYSPLEVGKIRGAWMTHGSVHVKKRVWLCIVTCCWLIWPKVKPTEESSDPDRDTLPAAAAGAATASGAGASAAAEENGHF